MWSRPFGVAVVAAAAVLGSVRPSAAAGISFLDSTIGLNFGCGSPATNPCPFEGIANQLFTTTTSNLLSFSQTFTNPSGPNGPTTYIAQSQSAYGSLHAGASASFNIGSQSATPTADSRFVAASSSFGEFLTINSPTQNGQQGFLTISFHLDGTISHTGVGNAFAFVGVQAGSDADHPDTIDEQFFPMLSSFDGTIVLDPLSFTFGQPFFLKTVLAAIAGTAVLCEACPTGITFGDTLGAGTGSAQFFNTLQLTGLTPTTTTHTFVSDASFVADSGTVYGFEGVVPEPSSLILLGTGLAMGGLHWRRRQRGR